MRKTSKIIVALLSVVLALVIFGGGFYAWYSSSGDTYAQHITKAEHYFEVLDFENAAIEYQRAIKKAPDKEEGYLGLARSYNAQGMTSMAESVLSLGIDRTDSAQLKLLLDLYTQTPEVDGMNKDEAANAKQDSSKTAVQFLERLKTTTYNEYRLRNGIESTSMEGAQCHIRVSGLAAELYYDETAVDRISQKPMSEGLPIRVVMDNILDVFGAGFAIPVESLRSQGAVDVTRKTDDIGRNVVEFQISSCLFTVVTENDMIQSWAWNTIQMPTQTGEGVGTGSCGVKGKVISATTGSGVANASLKVRKPGVRSGEAICSLVTDVFGQYQVNLDSGSYEVEVSCSGYNTEYFSIYVGSGSSMLADRFVLSPTLASGQIRIVLEWSSDPADLDSWLVGQTDSGAYITTSYQNRTAFHNGQKVAELDLDDTDGYGPETTTIYDINGVYRFSVVDYRSTGHLSQSGAVVKIYVANQSSPIVVNVCSGLEYGWAVCEIDHGEVRIINGRQATQNGAIK